ncbi:class I SAM-dependent methyltransferase [Nocardioides sambongensis]|uniref:class I SAM-dependent methyltransferase n=1 Tax=Nocardioides sambongensis TaxID=2589074 RepID=UPI00112D8F7E|nr:class I SAM-dependent methyltransferase [Nocardioides sambongensis]
MTVMNQPALKTRHRAMWASGDYPAVARTLIPQLGERVVDAADVGAGDRVLDVAAGAGNAALAAAARGAEVTASDLTPELFDVGRADAAARGLTLRWEEGDAEALPYDDAAFDAVVSCVGVMFAPFHQRAADELVRVTRPGGRIATLSWTPGGFIGAMLRTMSPYAPTPPPGAQPPPLWGSEEHVAALLGDRVEALDCRREEVAIDAFAGGAQFRDFFKANYGPTIAVYRNLAERPDDAAALDDALAALGEEHLTDGVMRWEYLLANARRR